MTPTLPRASWAFRVEAHALSLREAGTFTRVGMYLGRASEMTAGSCVLVS